MAIGPRLELRQTQHLAMTPQLQQAIRLLQMTNLELSDFIDSEIERNPLLERGDGPGAAPRIEPEAPPNGAAPAVDLGAGGLYGTTTGGVGRPDGGEVRLEETLVDRVSLLDHLDRQIATTRADPLVLAIARAIAAELDEDGYFRARVAETAARLGVDRGVAEEALTVVQRCEPTGIGARDLPECLALQLEERDRLDPAMRALLANIDRLARADFVGLRRACGVDAADFAEMLAEIRALDPRPARAFTGEASVTVAPDVFVRRSNVGSWVVELNTATLPRVLVNNAYVAEVARDGDRRARRYVSECQQNANWLVRSLAQRARTILKVSEEIVRQQDGFFVHGVSALKPMTLKCVADAISMHESTVSRVTSGKFVATERGTFELRYFFTAAIGATNGGDAHSAEAIRRRIAGMIAGEPPAKPLSDETIANLLEEAGVDIARRTVAKYRESMNIPSSLMRRRMHAVSSSG